MSSYVLAHHLIVGVLICCWAFLAYMNVFIFFAPRHRRHDFLDPDFGFKARFNLAGSHRSKCRLDTEADTEIPELGLDSGRVNVDCDVNPVRIAKAAAGVARTYGKYRRDRRRRKQTNGSPQRSGSQVKRKRTKINIDTEYERQRHEDQPEGSDNSEESDDD